MSRRNNRRDFDDVNLDSPRTSPSTSTIYTNNNDNNEEKNLLSPQCSSTVADEYLQHPMWNRNNVANSKFKDSNDTVATTTKNKKTRGPSEFKTARMTMTMIHFFLSYPRWSLSIFLFLASWAVPLVPRISDAVLVPYRRLHNLTKAEGNAYYECTVQAFDRLETDMNQAVRNEYDRVLQNRQFNLDVLNRVGELTGTCAMAGIKAREALYEWNVSNGFPLLYVDDISAISNEVPTNMSVCTLEDQEYIITSLGQDFEALEGEVSSILGTYTQSSESSFGRIKSYAEERTLYDYNFFVRDRIQPVIDLLRALSDASLYNVKFNLDPQNFVDRLVLHLEGFKATIDKLNVRVTILGLRVDAFFVSLNDFVFHYNDLYKRLVLSRNFALEFMPPNMKLPDYLKLEGIPLALQLTPPVFQVPFFNSDLLLFDDILENFVKEAIALIMEVMQKLQEVATKVVVATVEEIIEQIQKLLTLEDYDPPKFVGSQPGIETLDQEAAYLEEIGNAAESSTKLVLQKAEDLSNTDLEEVTKDIPELETGNYTFESNSTNFEYHNSYFPEFNWLKFFQFLFGVCLTYRGWLELLIQYIRFSRLSSNYEADIANAANDIKKGDKEVGPGGGGNNSKERATSSSKRQKFYASMEKVGNKCESSPCYATALLIVICFALYLIGNTVIQGVKWHTHLKQSCVHSSNGTNAANAWIAPTFINDASAAGNLLHLKSEYECRKQQRYICDRMYSESETAYRNDVIMMANLMQRHNESNSWLSRLDRCIKVEPMDGLFSEACCGLEGYSTSCASSPTDRSRPCPIDTLVHPSAAFHTLTSYMTDPACAANTSDWILKDSRFDCDALADSCSQTPCNGVNEELIRSLAIEADCLAQLYSHRVVLFLILAISHAVLINLCCKFIMDGIKDLHWKNIIENPTFIAYVDENGNLLGGNTNTVETRANEIDKKHRKRQSNGRRNISLGVLFFVIWVVFLIASRVMTSHFR